MKIKTVTSGEMREIDRISIDEIGIPASLLMNNAGKAVAEFIADQFKNNKITIFCGTGNNGGDGFAAAYYLWNRGFIPHIYLSGKKSKISDTSLVFMNLCRKMDIQIDEIDESNLSSIKIPDSSIILDAILGTGSTDAAEGIPKEFIKLINNAGNPVVSIDIPSGLSTDGEVPTGEFIQADFTIAIGLPKISHFTYPCKACCGELIIADIGFPVSLTSDEKLKVSLLDENLLQTINRLNEKQDMHKGDRGHTLLIGGFTNMEGAVMLTASALINSGCGLATIATTAESRGMIAGKIPEVMTLSLPEDPASVMIYELIKSKKIRSLIIGPGLGRSSFAEKVFRNIIKSLNPEYIKRVLIDGDGLFFLADFLEHEKLPENIEFIITPHFMEASRILKKDIDSIKNNRLQSCKELAVQTGCIVVLKGPATIISDGDVSFINTTGNNGLSTAGSGDVLSGIIGSFMNMDITAIEAAATGVFIHGSCADIYSETLPVSTMSASDIISNIRFAIKLKTNPV